MLFLTTKSLPCLISLCQCLLLSKEFHEDMCTLLSPFGRYMPARMKGYGRGEAKCKDEADGYKNKPVPQSKHLKDVLRHTMPPPGSHRALNGSQSKGAHCMSRTMPSSRRRGPCWWQPTVTSPANPQPSKSLCG